MAAAGNLQVISYPKVRPRTALIASADGAFRQRLRTKLTGLRWHVREARGGAEAWTESASMVPEAVIVDSWLPDLEQNEFLSSFHSTYPEVDLLVANDECAAALPNGPHRQELLYALRSLQETEPASVPAGPQRCFGFPNHPSETGQQVSSAPCETSHPAGTGQSALLDLPAQPVRSDSKPGQSLAAQRIPELVGEALCMLEVSRRIRLVAPRSTPVLIEGPTGSGKELVAEALHRLSPRNRKPFVAINCAAIPEALLEAELFGHTRGAFTGAVSGRTGRIESADGGTLFLDEIGEMPLALQAKLLRFVESGELQRIGDNQTVKVDVRILAATHRPLAQHAQTGSFRADLYYRLAVFLIRTPALQDHLDDLPQLVGHFLERMGRQMPVKQITPSAQAKLAAHAWPGNVRELEHVLERAAILAGDSPLMTGDEIDFGSAVN